MAANTPQAVAPGEQVSVFLPAAIVASPKTTGPGGWDPLELCLPDGSRAHIPAAATLIPGDIRPTLIHALRHAVATGDPAWVEQYERLLDRVAPEDA